MKYTKEHEILETTEYTEYTDFNHKTHKKTQKVSPLKTRNIQKCLADVGHSSEEFVDNMQFWKRKNLKSLRLLGGCHALRGADRGLSPTVVFLPPLRGSIWYYWCPWVTLRSTHGCVPATTTWFYIVFSAYRGFHPRLCSCHHYVVLYCFFVYRGLSPTAVFQSPLSSSKLLFMNY